MSDREHMPTPEKWRKLKAEWSHDYGLRRMEDRGVKYEDQADRKPDDAADRGKSAARPQLPSPGEIARNKQPYRPEPGQSRENAKEKGRGR